MSETLLLNASYEPLRVLSWERAICLWLDSKVEILSTYAERVYDSLRDWSGNMPAVVRLLSYVSLNVKTVKFSRINVFARDEFQCQYCGGKPGTASLTYDHVLPRSRGGKTTWNNISTCCIKCNRQKADRTPVEASMRLLHKPYTPTQRPLMRKLVMSVPNSPDEWQGYLYWNTELHHD